MIKNVANILTSFRILGSILLLYFPAFSQAFYSIYIFCGIEIQFMRKAYYVAVVGFFYSDKINPQNIENTDFDTLHKLKIRH